MRILYDSKSPLHKTPFGTLRAGQECSVSINIPKHCKTNSVKIQLFRENGGFFAAFFLNEKLEQGDYEIYSGSFTVNDVGLYFYNFFIETEQSSFALYKQGQSDTNIEEGSFWQLSYVPRDFFAVSDYFGKTMYQIFPDRFFKWGECDLKGKIEPYYIHKSTEETPDFRPDNEGEVRNCDFYGGNLKGIAKKLCYLKDLGVSVIYLNPIFKAYSNHRYDTADYKKIDEMLGNEDDFKNLCKKAHRLGIKIVLDGVFSHTGSRSAYFESAVSDKNSPYFEWYDFKNYPHDYTSWWGIKTLPCVNEMSQSFLDYIINDEDSVVAHWISLGADGFRLDVADELPDEFIKALRKRIKALKKDAILIGEVWEDASNKISYNQRREYFVGGELDSTMNYPFRKAILDFVLSKDMGGEFKNTVLTICENYPKEVVLSLMNSLSTHDTERVLTLLSGVKAPESKEQRAAFTLNENDLHLATKRLKCAAFIQFVLPGMPCIYYGDEIGTQGFEDPFCRSFFDWKKTENSSLKEFYKVLIKTRNKSDALKLGDTCVECISDGVLKIERCYKNKKAIAFVNCSQNKIDIAAEGKLKISHNAEISKDITLNPLGFALFQK